MGEQIEKRWSRRSGSRSPAGSVGAPPEVAEAERIGDVHFAADNFASALEYYARGRRLAEQQTSDAFLPAHLDVKIADCHRLRGHFRPALEQLESAKGVFRSLGPSPDLGRVYARQGYCVVNLGRYGRGRKFLEIAYQMLRPSSENEEIGNVELALGRVLLQTGDRTAAEEYFERALSTFRRIEHTEGIAHALNNLAVTLKHACRWREAIECYGKALKLSEKAGTYQRTAHCCLNLGIVHLKTGEWRLAEQYFERSLQTYTDIGSHSGLAKVLLARGLLLRRRHDWQAAATAILQALEIARRNGYAREEVLGLEFLGELAHERGDSAGAIPLLTEALALAESFAPQGDLVNEVLRRLGDATLAVGEVDAARGYAQRGLEISLRLGDTLERAACRRLLGLCLWRTGDLSGAEESLTEALSLFASASERLELGRTQRIVAQFCRERQTAEPHAEIWRTKALEHLRASAETLGSLEDTPESAVPLLELAGFLTEIGLIDEAAGEIMRALQLEIVQRDSGLQQSVDDARRRVEAGFADGANGRLPAWDAQETRPVEGNGFERLFQTVLSRTHSDRGALLFGSLEEPAGLQSLALGRLSLSEARRAAGLVLGGENTLAQGRPAIFLELKTDRRFPPLTATPLEPASSAVVVPLGVPGHPEGLLYLDRSAGNVAGPYRRSEFHLAQAMAQFASLGLVEMQRAKLIRENKELRERLQSGRGPFHDIVTQDAAMQEMLRIVERVGESTVTVLLEGETGTGKGLIAEAIHRSSPRRDKPFVPINCAALPENLLESELFGHVQGAFTGAVRDKRGLFEEAGGGTIFLDEVDKTSRAVQGKLLHVLDKREVRAVGANRWLRVDVRVICATNADLMACIRQGTFLEDLYYRLNDFVLRVPPLRERRDDISLLVDHFLEVYSVQLGKKPRGIAREVLQKLIDHAWRGNVRELEKAIRRLVVLVDDGELIDVGLLPPEILRPQDPASPAPGATLREEIAKLEARMIRDALETAGWNKAEVARRLHMSYPSLLTKIRLYKLERRRR
jgi:two-component system response regulator AtoC